MFEQIIIAKTPKTLLIKEMHIIVSMMKEKKSKSKITKFLLWKRNYSIKITLLTQQIYQYIFPFSIITTIINKLQLITINPHQANYSHSIVAGGFELIS